MTEFKNIIIVETNEAGQPTNLRRLEDGDTISNERLNADVRNAASKIDTVETTANNALTEAEAVSSTVYINSGTWGTGGGLDATAFANLTNASNAIAGFSSTSGTFASSNKADGVIVDADINAAANINGSKLLDDSVGYGKLPNITTGEILGRNPLGVGAGPIEALAPADARSTLGLGALATLGSVAAGQINASAVTATKINENAITADKIVDNTITNSELAAGAAVANIGTGGITATQLGTNAVETAKINASAVTAAKINENAITADKIVAGTITTTELATAAGITNDQLAGGITNAKLAGSISNDKLAGGITNAKLAGSITEDKLDGSIPQNKLASSGISKIFVTGTSGVLVSGAGDGDATPAPADGAVMVIDTAEARIKFRNKISGTRIEDATIPPGALVNASITNTQLADGAASDNVNAGALNSIQFNKLPLMAAETFAGNSNSIGGNMGAINMATAKTMLGLGAEITVGSTAPTSPSEGDLWYDTTTGVDDLFAYDSGRSKWLSVSTRQYYFARNAAATTSHAHIGPGSLTYNAASRIGYFIPYDMTIVGYAWNQGTAAADTTDWTHRLQRYNLTASANSTVLDIAPTGTYGRYKDMTLNTDFDADGLLGSNMVAGGSSTSVQHQTVTVFMKRRTS